MLFYFIKNVNLYINSVNTFMKGEKMEKKEGNKFLTGFDRAVKTIEDYGVGICFAAIVLLSVVTVFYLSLIHILFK